MAVIKNKIRNGVSTVEILIVVAILTIALVSLLGSATFSLKSLVINKEGERAENLAQEELEAIRNFRDGTKWSVDGLGTVTVGIAYHLGKSTDNPPKWILIQGEESIDTFTRKIVFTNVSRDTNDNIVASGGTYDSDTKKIIVTVSGKNKTVEVITYLTNWKQ